MVRSCFEGKWRFFANRPDLLTAGYHYFAEADTPAINGLHPFGSAVWNKDRGVYPDYPVGQVMKAGQTWYSGEAPAPLPPDNQIGETAEFSQPINYPPSVPVRVRSGFDARCYIVGHPGIDLDLDRFLRPDITDCCWQRVCARLLDWLNDHTVESTAAFTAAATLLWGAGYTIQVRDVPYARGSYALIRGDQFQIVLLPGLQDWAESWSEFWHGFRGTHDFGDWGTSQLWNTNATALALDLALAGWVINRPTTFAAHSKGGAVAAIVALRGLRAVPTWDFELLTFGNPKAGDERFVGLPGIRRSRHVANAEDPIPYLPPFLLQRDFPAWLTNLPQANAMAIWRQYPLYQYMRAGRPPEMRSLPPLPWELYAQLFAEVFEERLPDPFAQHYLSAYVARLAVCCNQPAFPFSEQLWEMLFGVQDNAIGGVLFGGEPDAPHSIVIGGVKGGGAGGVLGGGVLVGGTGGDGILPTTAGGVQIGGTGGDGTLPTGDGGVLVGGTGGDGTLPTTTGGVQISN